MTRSDELHRALEKSVQAGELAGAVGLVWHNGKSAAVCAGWRDLETRSPIERDTIFRIASMTKPITSVAALMLVDEGRIALDDPISRYAPEFAHMRVLRSPNGPLDETDEALRPITFDDLLTHRAGFTYASFHRGPISEAYHQALGDEIDSELTPDEWIANLAKLPLIGQPGSAMYYGCSTDLLGFLIARIEHASLGALLEQRIFRPLGMEDTGFLVPSGKHHRRAAAFGFDENGKLIQLQSRPGAFVAERPSDMTFESGSGGLWSTAHDYLKFARLFLGDGDVDGTRVLRPETLAKMMSNQLTDTQRANTVLVGQKPFAVGRGFGLGVSVVLETNSADFMRRGSPGTVSWPGAFGGWWEADPQAASVSIFLTHSMVDLSQMARGIGLGAWAAINDFQFAAMAWEPVSTPASLVPSA
jgi:CubicO group peptidase (beta-lactamase class C family)